MGENHHSDNSLSNLGWYAMGCAMLGLHYFILGTDRVFQFGAKFISKLRHLSLTKQQKAELRQIKKSSGLR